MFRKALLTVVAVLALVSLRHSCAAMEYEWNGNAWNPDLPVAITAFNPGSSVGLTNSGADAATATLGGLSIVGGGVVGVAADSAGNAQGGAVDVSSLSVYVTGTGSALYVADKGSLTSSGGFTSGGGAVTTIAQGGSLTVNGAFTMNGGAFVNSGTAALTNAVFSGGTVTNAADGVMTVSGFVAENLSVLANYGKLAYSSTAISYADVGTSIYNAGTVEFDVAADVRLLNAVRNDYDGKLVLGGGEVMEEAIDITAADGIGTLFTGSVVRFNAGVATGGSNLYVEKSGVFEGRVDTGGTSLIVGCGQTALFKGDVAAFHIDITNATGRFSGLVDASYVDASGGGVFETAAHGVRFASPGSILDVQGGTIHIGTNGSSTVYALDLSGLAAGGVAVDETTGLTFGKATNGQHTIIRNISTAANGTGNRFDISAGGFADFGSWLASRSRNGTSGTYAYSVLGDDIVVDVSAAGGSGRSRFIGAAESLGYSRFALGASDSYIDTVVAAGAGDHHAEGIGATTESVLNALGNNPAISHDFSGDPLAARAAYQGTTGKFLANSLDIAATAATAHQDMLAKALSPGLTAPDYGTASASSENGLASLAINCGGGVNRVWVGAFGQRDDAGTRGHDAGYTFRSAGAALGFDRTMGAVTVGGSFGAAFGSYKDKAVLANNSDIDTYSFSAYAAAKTVHGFFGRITAGYAYTDNDIDVLYTRSDREKARYHVGAWTAGATVGYEWNATDRLSLSPSVGLNHYDARSNTFATTTKTGMKLKYNSTEMPLALAARFIAIERNDAALILNARAGWTYAFGDRRAEGDFRFTGLGGAGSVYVEGRDPGRRAITAGAGAQYRRGKVDCALNYDYRRRGGVNSHAVYGSVGFSF